VWGCGLNSAGSEQGSVAACYEHGNEPSGSIKGKECFDQLSDYWLLKKDSSPWCIISVTCVEVYQTSPAAAGGMCMRLTDF
jgi:hypothetical protein